VVDVQVRGGEDDYNLVAFTVKAKYSCDKENHAKETEVDQTGGLSCNQDGTVVVGGSKVAAMVASYHATGQSFYREGVPSLQASDDNGTNHLLVEQMVGAVEPEVFQCHGSNVGPLGTLRKGNGNEAGGVPFVAHTLRSKGADAGEDGTGRGTPLVVQPAIAFHATQTPISGQVAPALGAGANLTSMGVRRLTPTECERLMGLPDGYTAFGADGKRISNSARYRMIGNGCVETQAFWLGQRIKEVHTTLGEEKP
jgi:site-specific DNA-cytosine methylase